jgi:peptide chain release factor 1
MEMLHKLEEVEGRYNELNRLLCDPKIIANREAYQKYAKAQAELASLVVEYQKYKQTQKSISETRELYEKSKDDADLRELALMEMADLEKEKIKLEGRLKTLLLPRDPNDKKNVILEIRAGTGGEEAGLFAAELFRMYSKYAEMMRWKMEILSSHTTGAGGIKEIIILVEGKMVYSHMKYESGVHRVQRIPVTESSGRIHTSAATVAVLPEAEEVELDINPNDLRIDVFRSSGPGGQSVNTTDSAVRINHIPTGLVVTCQDEKSQHKNKAKALKILRSRILDKMMQEQSDEISQTRKNMVGTGDRSERIRTYNYPQNRVTDHRINLTLYKLDQILEGNLNEFLETLNAHFQAEALKTID